MGEAAVLLAFLLIAGLVYVVLRLTLGPGRYRIIVDTIATGLLVALFFGGTGLMMFSAARTEPMSGTLWLVLVVWTSFTMVGLVTLWIAAYALWFWRRPLVEVDDDGVRMLALGYRHEPWARIAAVVNRSDNTEIPAWYVAFADGYRPRLGYLPFHARLVSVGWGRELTELTAAAELIRKHPKYSEKVTTK